MEQISNALCLLIHRSIGVQLWMLLVRMGSMLRFTECVTIF